MLAARGEMRHVAEFDYVIINEDLPAAIDDLVGVVRIAAALRQPGPARKPEFSVIWNRIEANMARITVTTA